MNTQKVINKCLGKNKEYTNLQYREAVISQHKFKGKKWNDMTKEEKAEYADMVGGK